MKRIRKHLIATALAITTLSLTMHSCTNAPSYKDELKAVIASSARPKCLQTMYKQIDKELKDELAY